MLIQPNSNETPLNTIQPMMFLFLCVCQDIEPPERGTRRRSLNYKRQHSLHCNVGDRPSKKALGRIPKHVQQLRNQYEHTVIQNVKYM